MASIHRRLCILALAALATTASHAQAFPNKLIKVVVPSPAGGPPDLILRAIIPKLSAALGQPIIIENRAGAGGMVGTAYVAKLPADGYTWLVTAASHVYIPAFNDSATYDPVRDFTHVALLAQNFGQMLTVHPDVQAKNLPELIALAKKNPGKLTYAHAGLGTAGHIPAEVMKMRAGVDMLAVPYKGVQEAMTDFMAGRIDIFFPPPQIALQHVQNGRVRALAITGSKRWNGMPDVPTMDQEGLKGFNKVNWFGLWLPAGAPPDVVKKIHDAVAAAVNSPDVKEQFDTLGLESAAMSSAEFAGMVASEQRTVQDVARVINAGIKK